MIELKQIRSFLAVAQQSSFSKAAESMFFSQSALSKQIALLEADLGVKLFLRDKHSVYLTDAGSSFLPVALDLQERAEHAMNVLSGAEADMRIVSTINIGYEPGLAEEQFSRRIIMRSAASLMRENPHVRVKLRRLSLTVQENEIKSGDIDLAICTSDQPSEQTVHDKEIGGITLLKGSMMIVLPKSMPLEDNGMPPQGPMKVFTMENDFRAVAQCLKVLPFYGMNPRFYYCSDLMNVMLAAESGQGAVIMPTIMKNNLDLDNVNIFPIDSSLAGIFFHAIWNSGSDDRYVKTLLSSIKEDFDEFAESL